MNFNSDKNSIGQNSQLKNNINESLIPIDLAELLIYNSYQQKNLQCKDISISYLNNSNSSTN